jgi:hypothetical protein
MNRLKTKDVYYWSLEDKKKPQSLGTIFCHVLFIFTLLNLGAYIY